MFGSLRGAALALCVGVLAGCETLVEADPRAGGVHVAVERGAYAPGDTVRARLVNASEVEVGYNLCFTTLLRREGGSWSVADEPLMICTAEMRPLRPGESVEHLRELPAGLRSGEYRLRASVHFPRDGGRTAVDSESFRVER